MAPLKGAVQALMSNGLICCWQFWKNVGFKLGAKDVFLNLAGEIRIEDPALDLAVAAAILSSLDVVIPEKYCLPSQLGSGELRNVSRGATNSRG